MIDLKDKVIIISDVEHAPGRQLAAGLAETGAIIACMEKCGSKDKNSIRQFVKETADRYGGIDALVNCGWKKDEGSVLQLTDDVLDEVFEDHILSAVYFIQACIQYFREKASIVNVSPASAEQGEPANTPAHSICGAALDGMSRAVGIDLMPAHIRVNNVVIDEIPYEQRTRADVKDELVMPTMRSTYPVHQLCEISEQVAPIVAFLCSEDSSAVNLRTIFADAGQNGIR